MTEQLYSTQPCLAPRECSPFLPWHIHQQPGQHKVENLPLLHCSVAKLCQPLITSSAQLQPLPEHLHPHAARPWGCLGMLCVANGQDDTFFKEEIQPGEALGGASGSDSPPCVQGKLPAMLQGEGKSEK